MTGTDGSQPVFTCLKSTMETPEQCLKSVPRTDRLFLNLNIFPMFS